jgi:UDP-glucose-4-epimerase GalE
MSQQQTVLVTGGAGFVGSHTCKALAGTGFLPVSYDDLSNGSRDAVRWGPLELGRLQDTERLANVISRYRPIAVLHFAASIEAGQSVRTPGPYYRNNVGGTLSLLKAMEAHRVQHIVFSSTAGVYGEPQATPIPETHPQAPVNPYGRSKMMAEAILRDIAASEGLNLAILRYFNAAGADPEGELAEQHDPETHLIPLALLTALGYRDGFSINGTDYDTPDGTCIRDYVHVSDLADAHVLALGKLLGGTAELIANLGSGSGYSVQQVVDAVRTATGREFEALQAPRRPGDPARLIADISRARELMGWGPKRSSLAQMVEHAQAGIIRTRQPDVQAV